MVLTVEADATGSFTFALFFGLRAPEGTYVITAMYSDGTQLALPTVLAENQVVIDAAATRLAPPVDPSQPRAIGTLEVYLPVIQR